MVRESEIPPPDLRTPLWPPDTPHLAKHRAAGRLGAGVPLYSPEFPSEDAGLQGSPKPTHLPSEVPGLQGAFSAGLPLFYPRGKI